MPIVRIDLMEGRSPDRKADLIRRVTEAVVAALQVQPEQVRVLLVEVSPEHWAVGGVSVAERTAQATPAEKVGTRLPDQTSRPCRCSRRRRPCGRLPGCGCART
jgi:4-oxalocrotonate tautomerase